MPKKSGENRPYAYRNFRDEVAAVALALAARPVLEGRMDRSGRASFGNRLGGVHSSDRLFLDWRSSWGQFEGAARDAGRRYRHYVKTDVRKFYPHIRRGQLIDALAGILPRDPIFLALRSLLWADGPNLAAGPTISGCLANVYLASLDEELLNAWNLRGRYFRYVDDMYLFGGNRRELLGVFRRLRARLWEHYGLPTHHGKAEVGRSASALNGPDSPASWVGLSEDFDRIARTLYHVPPEFLSLYARHPARTLRAYTQGLRAAGLFVSTDWLAQQFLSLRGRHPPRDAWDGFFHLRFPRLNIESPYGAARSWGASLLRQNPDFARAVGRLRAKLTAGFRAAAKRIPYSSRADDRRRKHAIFMLRFYAIRLSMFDCVPVSGFFQKFLDHPWALEPSVSANALLSDPNAVNRFLEALMSRRALLVRVRAAWALGELGAIRAIPALWRAAHPGFPLLIRLASLEAILRIDRYHTLNPSAVFAAARAEKIPAVRKYLYIILGQIRDPRVRPLLQHRAASERDFFARRAALFALHAPTRLAAHLAPPSRHAAASLLPSRTRVL
ncbi:hypothetical protein HY522_10585 [bacterium]|nr:hypothetical protein [bacterium]